MSATDDPNGYGDEGSWSPDEDDEGGLMDLGEWIPSDDVEAAIREALSTRDAAEVDLFLRFQVAQCARECAGRDMTAFDVVEYTTNALKGLLSSGPIHLQEFCDEVNQCGGVYDDLPPKQ